MTWYYRRPGYHSMAHQTRPAPPQCPSCEHPVLLNVTRCQFCGRYFHELCLSSRGCNAPACYHARRDPPIQYYEWRQFWAAVTAALVLSLVVTGLVSRPAADSTSLNFTAAAAISVSGVVGFVVHRRRRSGIAPWRSRASSLAALTSSLLCVAVSAAVIRPIPLVAYDLLAAAALGSIAICVGATFSPFSRTAGLLGVLLSAQSYAIIALSATPRVDRLEWSFRESIRLVRAGALPPMSYHPTGVVQADGKTLVMTDGGAYAVGQRIPGIGKVLRIGGSRIRVLNAAGREVDVPLASAARPNQSGSSEAQVPAIPPKDPGEIPDEKVRGLLKDLKDYDRVRQKIESELSRKRR